MFFYTPDWTDGTVRRFVKRVGPDLVPTAVCLARGRRGQPGPGRRSRNARRASCATGSPKVAAEDAALRVTDLAIDGKDVMRVLGIPPSRRIGEILEQLLEKVLDDPKLNERLSTLSRECASFTQRARRAQRRKGKKGFRLGSEPPSSSYPLCFALW
jgi:tRNA nucleotidyltransferase (CCA-adding enzyme)